MNQLAVIQNNSSDGFDVEPDDNRGVIRGTKLKFDNGDWETSDGTTIPDELIVADSRVVDQQWVAQRPVETVVHEPGEVYLDIDTRNAAFPQEKWEEGPYGPRPPWQRQYAVYLVNEATGAAYTCINGTFGQKLAVSSLGEKVRLTRKLRGQHVLPVIALKSAEMKTKFGIKERPEFEVLRWVGASGEAPSAAIEPPTSAEIVGDDNSVLSRSSS